MEKPQVQKIESQNPPKKSPVLRTDNLRVLRETKKKVISDLVGINRKDFGRRITASEYIALAVSLIRPEHLDQLRESSLSNEDRLKRRYQEYCAKHGKVSRDEFIGVLLSGDQSANT